jgi:hypothetical protein
MNFSVGIALQWGEKFVSCMPSKNIFSLIPLGLSQKPMSFSIDIGEIVAETMSLCSHCTLRGQPLPLPPRPTTSVPTPIKPCVVITTD